MALNQLQEAVCKIIFVVPI